MDTSRFEMEQVIMRCWALSEDLSLLSETICNAEVSADQVANALIGMQALHEMRMEKLFSMFEQKVKDGTIS
jgi:hypothetical protein